MDMRDVVIQLHAGEYHDSARYLAALNFRAIVLDTPRRRFHTAAQLLLQYLCGLGQLLPHLWSLRGLPTVVVFSHFAFVVKLLARCGLLDYERLFCFGFLVHDPRWFRVVRCLVRLDRAHDHYVIFSESEAELYRTAFGIERERMHFVPLGDWRQIRPIDGQVVPVRGDYYLAGGRSNRDYPALVEAFRSLPARLVILCSQVNLEELGQVRIPIMSRSCATFLSRPSMNTFEVRKPASSPCGTIRVRPGRVWRSRSCETRNALWLPGPGD